nr:RNA-dependent RNA polymerase [Sarcosphaera coronaria partitivirus]
MSQSTSPTLTFRPLRNYLAERIARIRFEWKKFQSNLEDPDLTLADNQDLDTSRMYKGITAENTDKEATLRLNAEFSMLQESFAATNAHRHEPFELNKPLATNVPLPENRLPAPGLIPVPAFFHSTRVIHPDPETSRPLVPDYEADQAESYLPGDIDFGPHVDPRIYELCVRKYPEYLPILTKFCRPAGTTDATFRDFNKEQIPSLPIPEDRKLHVLNHVLHFLDATPYLPIHFVDTQFAKLPLKTGTGYFNRFSYRQKAHARYSHPDEYARRPTSKGYYLNATLDYARLIIHHIKTTGLPFEFDLPSDDQEFSDDMIINMISRLNAFFNDHPTLLFTRNHISDREKTLKVRPVYAVDEIFLLIELMLFFPLTVQARKPSCAIMYGLETMRGSNHRLDFLAQSYSTFFTIDWSGYDQSLPRVITDIFFTDFIRRLIVISHGYAATYEYPEYPDLTPDTLYSRMDNLLHFLHLMYNNMTYLSADGYAFRRLFAGVPSGLYLTQYLDSFGNLFLLIDGMIEFGFTDDEIRSILLFVLGDDNSGFTNWPFTRLHAFISFLEKYAKSRYNMTLSKTKSVITTMRAKIETLSYQCNYGNPRRPIDKQVAQLCYPEHGLKEKTQSFRAIGLAYAAAGQSRTFHNFCFDMYKLFLPHASIDQHDIENAKRWLPGPLYATMDAIDLEINLLRFPTLEEVLKQFDHYHGPLSYAPKWNYAHFMHDPDYLPSDAVTMHEFEIMNNLTVRQAPNLPVSVNSMDSTLPADTPPAFV